MVETSANVDDVKKHYEPEQNAREPEDSEKSGSCVGQKSKEEAQEDKNTIASGRQISFHDKDGSFKAWVVVAALSSTNLEYILNVATYLGYALEQLNPRPSHSYDIVLRRVGG